MTFDASAGTAVRILGWLQSTHPTHTTNLWGNRQDNIAVEHHIPEARIAEFLADTELDRWADGESTGQTWPVVPSLIHLPHGYLALISDEEHWSISAPPLAETWLDRWISDVVADVRKARPDWNHYEADTLRNRVADVARQIVAYHGLVLVLRWGLCDLEPATAKAWSAYPRSDADEHLPRGGIYRWMAAIDYDTLTDLAKRPRHSNHVNIAIKPESPQ